MSAEFPFLGVVHHEIRGAAASVDRCLQNAIAITEPIDPARAQAIDRARQIVAEAVKAADALLECGLEVVR